MRATSPVRLHFTITQIGPMATLATFGMKWGHGQQLDHLGDLLVDRT